MTLNILSLFKKLKTQFRKTLYNTLILQNDFVAQIIGIEKLDEMYLTLPEFQKSSKLNICLNCSYENNLLNSWQHNTREEFQLLDTTDTYFHHILYREIYSPLSVNATYRLQKNTIEIPLSMIHPLFNNNVLDAELYGRFGSIIARELVRAFHPGDIIYFQQDTVNFIMQKKSFKRFAASASCFKTEKYEHLDSDIDNIVDTEGLRLAFDTFSTQLGTEFTDQSLQKKLFFASFARTWCDKKVDNLLSKRVNNAVGNIAEFAELFQCAEGTPMNPDDKCKVW